MLLDGKPKGIPIYADIQQAVSAAKTINQAASHLVIGLAPDGGRLSHEARKDIKMAIQLGLHVDSGLHDFLSEDGEITRLAKEYGARIRDVRKTPPRKDLHFFTGKIEEVTSLKVALLGTDSAIGKRTTAWVVIDDLRRKGYSAELVGTGQTAWMQGARYSIILDSLINDFVSGRPDVVILQHAPARKEYDGFPGYPLHPLEKQIQAIELLFEKPVVAITINHEDLDKKSITSICEEITKQTGLPACDVLLTGAEPVFDALRPYIKT
jgi:uncharacterized NAD-dependent epimerase/dehydratase family protein